MVVDLGKTNEWHHVAFRETDEGLLTETRLWPLSFSAPLLLPDW